MVVIVLLGIVNASGALYTAMFLALSFLWKDGLNFNLRIFRNPSQDIL